jgi:hypothetical protein
VVLRFRIWETHLRRNRAFARNCEGRAFPPKRLRGGRWVSPRNDGLLLFISRLWLEANVVQLSKRGLVLEYLIGDWSVPPQPLYYSAFCSRVRVMLSLALSNLTDRVFPHEPERPQAGYTPRSSRDRLDRAQQ